VPKPTLYSFDRLSPAEVAETAAGSSSSALMADLQPRMLSPSPLPNSGSFLGPNTSRKDFGSESSSNRISFDSQPVD